MLKLSSGLSLHTLRLPLALSALIFLTSCGGLNPISLLTGGGPNVAANVQAGAENNQGINIKTGAPSVSLRPNAKVETVDQSTTNNTTVDPWIVLLLILGWLLPSPNEMARWVTSLFKRNTK